MSGLASHASRLTQAARVDRLAVAVDARRRDDGLEPAGVGLGDRSADVLESHLALAVHQIGSIT
jgi:hypothetical protein